MNLSYFAHTGHEHMTHHAAQKGTDALMMALVAASLVTVFVIAVGVFDARQRSTVKAKQEKSTKK